MCLAGFGGTERGSLDEAYGRMEDGAIDPDLMPWLVVIRPVPSPNY